MQHWLTDRRRVAILALAAMAVIAVLVGAYLAYERWFPWEQHEIE